MIKLYQNKPIITKAIQYDGTNALEIKDFVGGEDARVDNITDQIYLQQNGNEVLVKKGDYIIQNKNFVYSILDKDTFEKEYIEVDSNLN